MKLWGRRRGHRDVAVLIGEGSNITGTCVLHGIAVLNGAVEGEIHCRGTLTVGPRGVAKANIVADSVVIEGEVAGNVTGQERVELRATARMAGDIHASVIVISEGAQFRGNCRIRPTKPSGDDTSGEQPKGQDNCHSEAPSTQTL